MGGLFPDFQPRPTDIIVAIMGMTGSGKSTFISLCTGEDVDVGHNLQACTQHIGIYKCQWSSTVDVYLVDTPGFDDTNRSDTDILKDIATWLTDSYEKDLKLSGLIYLHRITDLRMGGSAKKNLFMFRKLCGPDALQSVLLVTTMWEFVEPSVGKNRETELVSTKEFWGILVDSGAAVHQHDNTREKAMSLLKLFVKKKRMTMQVQKEMVNERKTLDQTQAGMELESELQKERERFSKDLAETSEMIKEAIDARDQESAEMLRQHKADMQSKIDRVIQQREELKVSMEKMHAEKLAEFEKRYEEQYEQLRKREESIDKTLQQQKERDEETQKQIEHLQQQLKDAGLHNEHKENLKSNESTTKTPVRRRKAAKPAKKSNTPATQGMPEEPSKQAHDAAARLSFQKTLVPGPNRIKENVNVTLSGDYYFFLGPAQHFWNPPDDFRTAYKSNQTARYIAFGTAGSWYRHYHIDDKCLTDYSESLGVHYPEFLKWLDSKKAYGCPIQVTLGNNGHFYIRTKKDEYGYSLPQKLNDCREDFRQIQRVWLGADNAYIIQRKNNTWAWDLAGNYGRLSLKIGQYDGIKDIAMNIEDPTSYIILSERGAGAWNCGGNEPRFDFPSFQNYMATNFGIKW